MERKVIFDFNGTLFFDNDKHIKAWSAISNIIRGYGISTEELHTHFNGVPNKEIIQYLCGTTTDENTIKMYSLLKEKYYRNYCREDIPNFHLVEGAEELFNKLKDNNIPFTIASASIKENMDFFVKSFHLDTWIQPQHIIFDNGTYKDKIAMFREAANILHASMEDVIIFEDSISGIQSAYLAGCQKIIVVDSANKSKEYQKLPGVISVINNYMEFHKYIKFIL